MGTWYQESTEEKRKKEKKKKDSKKIDQRRWTVGKNEERGKKERR